MSEPEWFLNGVKVAPGTVVGTPPTYTRPTFHLNPEDYGVPADATDYSSLNNVKIPDDHPDASTGTLLRDVPPGRVFRARGHVWTKRANGQCVDHRDGGDAWLEGDTECWLVTVGGWVK